MTGGGRQCRLCERASPRAKSVDSLHPVGYVAQLTVRRLLGVGREGRFVRAQQEILGSADRNCRARGRPRRRPVVRGGRARAGRTGCRLPRQAPRAGRDQAHRIRHPAHRRQDLRRAGEGYGFAFAQDDICTMANDYVTVDAQRSRYFGPSGTLHAGRQRRVASPTSTRTSSSSRSSTRGDRRQARRHAAADRAREPSCTSWPAGYVAGYNRYLRASAAPPGFPTRAAAARRGCTRSRSRTSTAASTS